jgi:linoleoyl-CoA desaturase
LFSLTFGFLSYICKRATHQIHQARDVPALQVISERHTCQGKNKIDPMNKLKFSKDEGSEFYKELNEKVEQYFSERGRRKSGNKTMIFKIILYFSLDIMFYLLMISSTSAFAFCLFYLLMGLSVLLTAFNISHDAAHGVAVKSRSWNKLLFSLSFNLQGNNAYVWGKNHTESHHLYTNIEGSDIDVLNNPLFRMTESQPLKWFHKYQFIYAPFLYLLYSLNWFFFRETLMLVNYSSRTIKIAIPKNEVVKLVIYKLIYIGYMIILPAYLLPFGWTTVLLAFVLNHFMVSLIFVGVLGVSHLSDFVAHPVPDKDNKLNMSWPKLQMCTSVDYNADSIFFNWTLGGFNAHSLHHLLPNICHVHYPGILPIFKALSKKHGLTYMEMPYRRSLASHFRFLKGMGTQLHFNPIPFEG